MTFEDWWEKHYLWCCYKNAARKAWTAAKKAERERIKKIIYEATDGGWGNYELLAERIGE